MSGIGRHARSTPDATAVVTLGGAMSYAEMNERHRRLGGLLAGGGLQRGDRVAVLAANRPEWLEVSIGSLRAGIVPVPVSPLLALSEVAYLIQDSGARWLFSDRAIDDGLGLERVVTFGDAYERCLHEATPISLAEHSLTRPLHYTSGTTATPKGVWVAPAGADRAAALSDDFQSLWGLEPGDVHLVCSPLSHSAPHRFALRTLEAGGTVVLPARFDAAEMLTAIELFGVTSTFVVPTHLVRVLSLGSTALKRHDIGSLRLLAHAGAPIAETTKRAAIDLFPTGSVWEFYGSTEGQATRISSDEWLRKPGSVGSARSGAEIIIMDETGRRLVPGEVGEVWIRDPRAERFEYWGDASKTTTAWRGDAFTIGDLGHVDEDGYLFLRGRKHDTIVTGGINVYPGEVEEVISSHPAVADVVVYGSPHPEWGQQVLAAVVARPGLPLDAEHLRRWARARLAGFKCPRRIDVVDELPRTATGKLRRGSVGQ